MGDPEVRFDERRREDGATVEAEDRHSRRKSPATADSLDQQLPRPSLPWWAATRVGRHKPRDGPGAELLLRQRHEPGQEKKKEGEERHLLPREELRGERPDRQRGGPPPTLLSKANQGGERVTACRSIGSEKVKVLEADGRRERSRAPRSRAARDPRLTTRSTDRTAERSPRLGPQRQSAGKGKQDGPGSP